MGVCPDPPDELLGCAQSETGSPFDQGRGWVYGNIVSEFVTSIPDSVVDICTAAKGSELIQD